jgi:type VII secretion integral membrane protein EccD
VADVANMCRLTVQAPTYTFDLAVPTDVELVELVPTIVTLSGSELDETGLSHGGWVLQRLGEDPLDGERTMQALGVRDGETLYLRPQRDAMPAVHFDDMTDGITTTLSDRTDSWKPALTRGLLLTLALVTLSVLFATLSSGGAPEVRVALLAGVGVILLAGGGAVGRGLPDRAAGAVLAGAGTAYLTLTVALAWPDFANGWILLAVGLTLMLSTLLSLALVGGAAPLFVAGCLAGFFAALGGLAMLAGASPAGAAGVVAVFSTIVGALAPAIAFRLSGLRMPLLPTNVEQLQEDIDPFPDRLVRVRANHADTFLNGLYAATGVVEAVCVTVLVNSPGLWPFILAAVLSLRLALHGLPLVSRWQRLATVLPGCYGFLLLVMRLAAESGPIGRAALCFVLLMVTAGLIAASRIVPGRRFVPYWGRAADLAHSAAAISTIPLALQLLGLFGYLRALVG